MLIMARPRKPRWVSVLPTVAYFKPKGIPLSALEEVVLRVEELEAIRLRYLEDLEQDECAERMKISRATFQRVLDSANKKIADALVNGKAIKVEGGDYKMAVGRGMGRGGFGRRAGGPPSVCVCPACRHEQPKVAGVPCSQVRCEKCGTLMVRGD